jgi:hypothetical protein
MGRATRIGWILLILPSRLPSELNEGLSDQEKSERREKQKVVQKERRTIGDNILLYIYI